MSRPSDVRGDGGAGTKGLRTRPVQREETHAALRLLMASGGRPADESQVVDFLRFAVQRGIHLGDLWLAEREGRMLSVALPMPSPGRTMLLLVPSQAPLQGEESAAAGALIDAVCAAFARRNVRLAQVLLDSTDEAARDLYTGIGFRHMAELIYLQALLPRRVASPEATAGMSWLTYSPATHGQFATAISESYRDSFDCPALNGLRDIDDIIAGHQATGQFDPRRWFLLRENAAPGRANESTRLGVLLLNRTLAGDAMELVYLGLQPAARGRGLGDVMMRQALATTASEGLCKLSLAVDSGNVPALKLYHRHGLRRVTTKLAMMRILGE